MNSNSKDLAEKIWCKKVHLYFRATRGLSLGVRAVVLNDCGEVLLVRHTYASGWQFPGGGVAPNETVEKALARELEEETGLKLVGMPNLHCIFLNRQVSKRDHVLVYICETAGEISARSPSLEISSLSFFDLAHLPEDIKPGTRHQAPGEGWMKSPRKRRCPKNVSPFLKNPRYGPYRLSHRRANL